ncbi:MAG: hypothetical protein CFE21_04015 [Bacteroidetes bacterium B1(2017)]|nr:MAG: hypothetical protein CFE21_04015 [Bacteroidetes bacterium B1(2017)]
MNSILFKGKHVLGLNQLLLLLLVSTLSSCHYFKIAASFSDGSEIESAITSERYLIIHQGSEVFHLNNPALNYEKGELYGKYSSLPYSHQFYRNARGRNTNFYRKDMGHPETEVHIYVSEFGRDSLTGVIIPIASVQRMDVYELERGTTFATYVLGVVGGFFAFIFLLALLLG